MSRPKKSRNKNTLEPIIASKLSTEERINFIANLIIDHIVQDQNNGQKLYKKLLRKEQ